MATPTIMATVAVTIAVTLVGVAPHASAAPASIPLGAEAPIVTGTPYAVAGTALSITLNAPQRANLVGGGHAWGGTLHVCEHAACTDLGLTGPDRPPTAWHGYAFTLVFVDPTSVLVTKQPAR